MTKEQQLRVTPKDFFLWAGAMIALYVSVFAFLTLFFNYIDYTFPDTLNNFYDPYSSGIRAAIASLVVMLPLFFLLIWVIRRDIAAVAARADLWVRRWALVLTIFIAGLTAAIDLITLINTFLGGTTTIRFVAKVTVVLLVATGVFLHFLADMWGFWDTKPKEARAISASVGVMVFLTIVAGFLIMGTPGQIRLYRFDDEKVAGLQQIQYQIINYWQQKQKLPTQLSELNDPISGFRVPKDSQTGASYEYELIAKHSFKLCAQFNDETQWNSNTINTSPYGGNARLEDNNWWHVAGRQCFDRTIDPELYPPFDSTKPSVPPIPMEIKGRI